MVNSKWLRLKTSPDDFSSCLLSPRRCQALQHPGQLPRGDQAVRLWRERAAHRFHGQLLRWNTLLHVGESAPHASAPTPFPLALSPLSFSSRPLAPPSASPSFSRPCQEPRAELRKGVFGKEWGDCAHAFFPLTLETPGEWGGGRGRVLKPLAWPLPRPQSGSGGETLALSS